MRSTRLNGEDLQNSMEHVVIMTMDGKINWNSSIIYEFIFFHSLFIFAYYVYIDNTVVKCLLYI